MTPNPDYEWDWFDEHDSYGVRRGTEIHCLTARTEAGWQRARAIAATLNATLNATRIDGSAGVS